MDNQPQDKQDSLKTTVHTSNPTGVSAPPQPGNPLMELLSMMSGGAKSMTREQAKEELFGKKKEPARVHYEKKENRGKGKAKIPEDSEDDTSEEEEEKSETDEKVDNEEDDEEDDGNDEDEEDEWEAVMTLVNSHQKLCKMLLILFQNRYEE